MFCVATQYKDVTKLGFGDIDCEEKVWQNAGPHIKRAACWIYCVAKHSKCYFIQE